MVRVLLLALWSVSCTSRASAPPEAEHNAAARGPAHHARATATSDGTKTPVCEGARASFRVDAEPAEVSSMPDGARLTLDLVLDSRFHREARLRYAVELIASDGTPAMPPHESANLPLPAAPAGSQRRFSRFWNTAPLPDGFYFVRVTAVAANDDESHAAMAHVYFEVDNRAVTILGPVDWYDRSGAFQARAL